MPTSNGGLRLALLVLLLVVAARPCVAQSSEPAPRVGLVTMQPGPEYWSRFGHNAILIDDGESQRLYNYGYFDFAQPGFLTRFLRGRMLYRLVELPLQADLAGYAESGRGVDLQWLDIAPDKARELAAFLAWNARPENAEYRYDYFVDNCSTRVRDALDGALDGALERQLRGRSHGLSFRTEARRLAATLPWLYLGIHLGLGPFTDRPISLWEESYIPMRLRDAVNEARSASGGPLVLEQHALLPHRGTLPPSTAPQWRWRFLLAGLLIASLLLGLLRRGASRPQRFGATLLAAAVWGSCGIIGTGLLLLWGLTDHAAAWGNENALLFSPLCLLLLPALGTLARGADVGRALRMLGLMVAGIAGVAMFLKFLPFRIQDNADWIALMLPIHLALAWRLSRREPVADPDRAS